MLTIRHIVTFITFYIALVSASVVFETERIPGTTKPIAGESPLLLCDLEEKQLLDISAVVLSPNPPERGNELLITATGEVKTTIKEGAYVDVEVRLGYIKLLTQTFDLCEVLKENDVNGLTCPVKPGVYDLKKKVEIPDEVPPGKYTILARAYTIDNDLLTCITGEVIFPL
ncbi:similar to Saccharomyces cerevisiae YDL046W NPC2 Functional homolog of human NPC2/He1 [Maudiozyma barnettii]|uniref:Phosphatidylglycerol/phosphatidylinositol transfer protein n=1 Tax=Maudiozyma barnettii TaxID=61262 RepID=A0A8H2VDF4_9SACH|nr:sterol transporter [Kazachstania barnettii]CAB4253208.1 similar to Saccharomyces cerevisiae YDL046W NPC2 Functional homolog of human NPC2/He1 [Kazachstania barnettii]CAD1780256.1 similar to Saccharomyces cerevisiae YDL046W NPC2 Functional homolog of human NPC2/He1 [Kazachstania barnettii]